MTFGALLTGCAVVAVAVAVLRPGPAWRSVAVGPDAVRRPDRHHLSAGSWQPGLTRRRRERAIDEAMPDLLDLLVVTLQAGLPAPAALATVAPFVHPLAAAAIDDVITRTQRGDRFVDALDALVDHLGTRALGLVAAIGAAERWGLPLAPTVDRIADDARHHRRRLAEIEARRLPVRLSVPLVCCTLPSFVCIAIGPLVVGALSSLRAA